MASLTWACAHPDGTLLGLGSDSGRFTLWDLKEGKAVQRLEAGGPVRRARWTPDGRRLLVATADGRLLVLSGDGQRELARADTRHGELRDLAVEPRGEAWATCGKDGVLRVWSPESFLPRLEIAGAVGANAAGFLRGALVAGFEDGSFAAWTPDGRQKAASGPVMKSPIVCLAVHPAGGSVVFGGAKGGLQELVPAASGVWAPGGRWKDLPMSGLLVYSLEFAADGRFVAAYRDGCARVFASTRDLLGTALGIPSYHLSPAPTSSRLVAATCACFVSSAGLVATSHSDGRAKLWRGDACADTLELDLPTTPPPAPAPPPDDLPGRIARMDAVQTRRFKAAAVRQALAAIDGKVPTEVLSGEEQTGLNHLRFWLHVHEVPESAATVEQTLDDLLERPSPGQGRLHVPAVWDALRAARGDPAAAARLAEDVAAEAARFGAGFDADALRRADLASSLERDAARRWQLAAADAILAGESPPPFEPVPTVPQDPAEVFERFRELVDPAAAHRAGDLERLALLLPAPAEARFVRLAAGQAAAWSDRALLGRLEDREADSPPDREYLSMIEGGADAAAAAAALVWSARTAARERARAWQRAAAQALSRAQEPPPWASEAPEAIPLAELLRGLTPAARDRFARAALRYACAWLLHGIGLEPVSGLRERKLSLVRLADFWSAAPTPSTRSGLADTRENLRKESRGTSAPIGDAADYLQMACAAAMRAAAEPGRSAEHADEAAECAARAAGFAAEPAARRWLCDAARSLLQGAEPPPPPALAPADPDREAARAEMKTRVQGMAKAFLEALDAPEDPEEEARRVREKDARWEAVLSSLVPVPWILSDVAALQRHLKEKGLRHQAGPQGAIVFLPAGGPKAYPVDVRWFPDAEQVLLTAAAGFEVPAPRKAEVARALERIHGERGRPIWSLEPVLCLALPLSTGIHRGLVMGDLRDGLDSVRGALSRNLEELRAIAAGRATADRVARSSPECHLYMSLHPCSCGDATAPFKHAVVQGRSGLAARYEGPCPRCRIARRFELGLDPEIPPFDAFGGARPSSIICPGQFALHADALESRWPADPSHIPRVDRAAALQDLSWAARALEEVAKFVPQGSDRVPDGAFTSAEGREALTGRPHRFRLEALRSRIRLLRTKATSLDLLARGWRGRP